jgi:uncharacterized iron-regulated membrane protein
MAQNSKQRRDAAMQGNKETSGTIFALQGHVSSFEDEIETLTQQRQYLAGRQDKEVSVMQYADIQKGLAEIETGIEVRTRLRDEAGGELAKAQKEHQTWVTRLDDPVIGEMVGTSNPDGSLSSGGIAWPRSRKPRSVKGSMMTP